jgi:hypothetical protein
VYGPPVIVAEVDPTLNELTARLVWATISLAAVTLALAAAQFWGVWVQRKELTVVKGGSN